MFVNFGTGKCPVCGDFGKTVEKDIFHCGRCSVSFNQFSITTLEIKEHDKYWN